MRIDAHQHYWHPGHGDYGWLVPSPALAPIHRAYAPADLHPLLDAAGVDATVLVQAAPSEDETRRLLAIASAPGSRVLGVVGWCDFGAADAAERIARLAQQPLLKGLRPMLHDLPETDWLLRPDLAPAWRAMQAHGLTLDLLIRPAHLEVVRRFAERWPALAMVIDHGAKPVVSASGLAPWAQGMRGIARDTAIACKLSGLWTELPPGADVKALRPFVEVLLDAFGPQRLLWGSDWPVLELAGRYAEWHALCQAWLAPWDDTARDRVFGRNAMRFYGLAG